MKKSIVIICMLCLSFGTTLKAQYAEVDSRNSPTFGLKAGLNYSNVWDEEGQDFNADPKFGFVGGLFIGIPIGQYIGIQPELLFSQKGFQGSGTLSGSAYSFSRTTSYLDIPLQLQVKPSESFTIVVGPQYSYLLNSKNVFNSGTNSYVHEQEFENDNIRKNIFGLVVGGDIYFESVVISLRTSWDLQTNNGDGTSSTPRYKNQLLQLTIGFQL